ncbi:sensor histidine kinase [Algicella marina]|uniref:histidine kinase n=1 Tax=Algicella marina TaxID=2683284 RepID=A0A6P1SYC7_9RHOB|nr:HAMP domain-containing sensor histidine kinase [Algicella marina]QHQ35478.1 hypothetical protein GO499_09885 [Algicella marina]
MLILLALVALFAIGGSTYARLHSAQTRIEAAGISLPSRIAALEHAIGYGGMIHDFKNYVLRPTEDNYRTGALNGIREARLILTEVEQIAADFGVSISTDAQRAVIAEYSDVIPQVRALHEQGMTAREIDQLVRISDSAALDEISDVHAQIGQALAQQLTVVHRGINTLFTLTVFASAVTAFLLFALYRREVGRQISVLDTRKQQLELFTGIAAHDLRTPLRQITSLADFAREDLAELSVDTGEIPEFLEDIASRARRMEHLVQETLYFTQGKGTADPIEDLDLEEIVREIGALHMPAQGSLIVDTPLARIPARRIELEIVLRNLIDNAVKHHGGGSPTVRVRHHQVNGYHLIEVEDDGPGIPDGIKARMLARPHSDRPGQEELGGIGLSATRRILANLGGNISVHDAGRRGSVFEITIPARATHVAEPETTR